MPINISGDDFLDGVLEAVTRLVDVAREDLAAFVTPETTAMAASFAASGDQQQLELLAFRLRTYARTQNLHALIAARETVSDGILFVGFWAAKALAAA